VITRGARDTKSDFATIRDEDGFQGFHTVLTTTWSCGPIPSALSSRGHSPQELHGVRASSKPKKGGHGESVVLQEEGWSYMIVRC
jgi:hypothetical protein